MRLELIFLDVVVESMSVLLHKTINVSRLIYGSGTDPVSAMFYIVLQMFLHMTFNF